MAEDGATRASKQRRGLTCELGRREMAHRVDAAVATMESAGRGHSPDHRLGEACIEQLTPGDPTALPRSDRRDPLISASTNSNRFSQSKDVDEVRAIPAIYARWIRNVAAGARTVRDRRAFVGHAPELCTAPTLNPFKSPIFRTPDAKQSRSRDERRLPGRTD